jgi:UDP-N-acetylmuramoylalanine--D-glutamate ligase
MSNDFKNKKVLVFGLGLLGGGVATTNWLLKHGAKVTVTDLKTKAQLAPSLKKIKGKVALRLGGHREEDIEANDIIVFNPDISVKNPYAALARKLGKQIENEATIFYGSCAKPIVGVTGTRGKTTTATWIQHLLGRTAILAGNRYDHTFLGALDGVSRYRTVVIEIPSYHLEYFPFVKCAPSFAETLESKPHIALITNLSPDHMNRHGSLEEYAATKGNIFLNQTVEDHLVLNREDKWTKFFLERKPKAKVWFFSLKPLGARERGVFVQKGMMYLRNGGAAQKLWDVSDFERDHGTHNLKNFLAAALAAHLSGASWKDIVARMKTLPGVPFRQEVIFNNPQLTIVNDTTATSPEGGIAAIERFTSPRRSTGGAKAAAVRSCILIAGGTDRGLDFCGWARIVHRKIAPKNLILLSGSATDKMRKALGVWSRNTPLFDSLQECFEAALKRARGRRAVILFSPASKSFEKFRNEYDRGEKFNALVARWRSRNKKGRR